MVYEIHCDNKIIGTTKFERGDPPMGFVVGELVPSETYDKDKLTSIVKVFIQFTNEQVQCEMVTIEDLSEELGEQAIEVTALLVSSDEFEKHFSHHNEIYENQFK